MIKQIEEFYMELNTIKNEALKLPAKLRADLARQLLNSLDNLEDSEIEDLWVEEALKRNEEIENEEVKVKSHESIMEEVRAMLK
jgi:uncharacterized protein YpbB